MNEIITKMCTKCGTIKTAAEFYKYSCWCKKCKKEYSVKYQNDHIENKRRNARKYVASNKEKLKQYRLDHKENFREYNKKYVATHKESRKVYNESHADMLRESRRKYKKNNPEVDRVSSQNRRAKMAGGKLTAIEWHEVLEKYGYACLKCGSTERIEIDHVVPIALGGKHEAANVQPLCRNCNAKKSAKTADYRPKE